MIPWTDKYLLGIEELDNQHKEIWRIMNLAYSADAFDYSSTGLKTLVEALIDYALLHFETEEAFMRSNNYAGYVAHAQEHQRFWNGLQTIATKTLAKEPSAQLEVVAFVKNWITSHVLTTDIKLKEVA